jgi:hypothetical protein
MMVVLDLRQLVVVLLPYPQKGGCLNTEHFIIISIISISIIISSSRRMSSLSS